MIIRLLSMTKKWQSTQNGIPGLIRREVSNMSLSTAMSAFPEITMSQLTALKIYVNNHETLLVASHSLNFWAHGLTRLQEGAMNKYM